MPALPGMVRVNDCRAPRPRLRRDAAGFVEDLREAINLLPPAPFAASLPRISSLDWSGKRESNPRPSAWENESARL